MNKLIGAISKIKKIDRRVAVKELMVIGSQQPFLSQIHPCE
jgi:hypothetical protein